MTTASCESVFLAIFKLALMRDDDAAMIPWVQTQSTRARLEMVRNVFRAAFPDHKPASLMVDDFARKFRGLTRQRNFLCHSTYGPHDGVMSMTGYEIVDGDEVIKQTTKKLNKGTCNEIDYAIDGLNTLNHEMWDFIRKFQVYMVKSGMMPEPILYIPPPLPPE